MENTFDAAKCLDSKIEVNSILVRSLVSSVDEMPAFPINIRKILEVSKDLDCTVQQLISAINSDPVITLKILRVVNSSYYGLKNKISSLEYAIVYLGLNTIKNLAISIAAISAIPLKGTASFDPNSYLKHSLATARISKVLASNISGPDPSDYFLAGLLHDFGKVVLAKFKPDEFDLAVRHSSDTNVRLHEALNVVLGLDYATVGGMLLARWEFPANLVEAIVYQNTPEVVESNICSCVYAANLICEKIEQNNVGCERIIELPHSMRLKFGGAFDEILASIKNSDSMFDEQQKFGIL